MTGSGTQHGASGRDERLVAPYLDYVTAFNAADLRAVARHLAENAFVDFYRTAWQHFDEELTVSDIRTAGDQLSAHLSTRVEIHTDWPDCPIRPMYAGAGFTVSGRMRYRFHGDRICHIADDVETSSPTL